VDNELKAKGVEKSTATPLYVELVEVKPHGPVPVVLPNVETESAFAGPTNITAATPAARNIALLFTAILPKYRSSGNGLMLFAQAPSDCIRQARSKVVKLENDISTAVIYSFQMCKSELLVRSVSFCTLRRPTDSFPPVAAI
jgi:hypothetical protein